MEHRALGGNAVAQDLEDVLACPPVVDYDRLVQALRHLQLGDEQLYLAPLVTVLLLVVQPGLADCDHPGELHAFFYYIAPVVARGDHLGWAHADRMEDPFLGLEEHVFLLEVMQAVVYGDNPRHAGKLRLLDGAVLLVRILE